MTPILRDEKGRLLPGQQSINPAGRPPRATEAAMLDDIFAWFKQPVNREQLFAGWQKQIARGNPKAVELALAYLAGKPRTDIQLGGLGGGLNIVVEYIDAQPVSGELVAETIAEAEDEDSEQ